ncbi:hypothetical protein MRB53_009411 [Persea americana]|uniref:Uncharacterized protein n=1 Tax=Persea americana TaxID=3435 RepID=A0ACC2LQ20_PERAE|nr:hypothetical protein MRB53_009411 [Persea americana]
MFSQVGFPKFHLDTPATFQMLQSSKSSNSKNSMLKSHPPIPKSWILYAYVQKDAFHTLAKIDRSSSKPSNPPFLPNELHKFSLLQSPNLSPLQSPIQSSTKSTLSSSLPDSNSPSSSLESS